MPKRSAREIRTGLKATSKARTAQKKAQKAKRKATSTGPTTTEPTSSDTHLSPDDVYAAIARAHIAQQDWAARSVGRRAQVLRRFRARLLDDLDAFTALIVEDTGKTVVEALAMELLSLLEFCVHCEEHAADILADELRPSRVARHKRIRVRHVPRGVVGVLAPFNFPIAIAGSDVLSALITGNAVVVKPSEHASASLLHLQRLLHESGVPADVLQVVCGGPDTGRALTTSTHRHERVDFVSFTGSTRAGRQVAAACAAQLIPHRVELGGNGAAIVLPDAHLERTAQALTWGAFANAGQVCAAVQRIYVHRAVEEPLVRLLRREVGKLRTLGPHDVDNEVADLCHPALPSQMKALLQDAVDQGGHLLGGKLPDDDQSRIRPTFVVEANGARLFDEECFGPVVGIAAFDDDKALVRELNQSDYGLAAYVFTEDADAGRLLAESLDVGTVMLNDVLWAYGMPEAPWSGRKDSGYGVSHGTEGLRALCHTQVVHEERVRLFDREPFWFPYGPGTVARLRQGIRALYGDGLKSKMKGLFDASVFRHD